MLQGGEHGAGNVVAMDAAEGVAGFGDAAGGAGAQIVERGAAGAVNAGEAEQIHREAVTQGRPLLFRRHPALAARAGRGDLRGFIDPGAGAVAIDAGGGQVAGPAQIGRGADLGVMGGEHRVPRSIRCGGGDEMGDAGQGGAREGDDFDPGHGGTPAGGAAGAHHAPAGGDGGAGDGEAAIAQAEDQ